MVYHSQRLDDTFFALSDPTRRAILVRLAGGERTISELAGRFDMSLPAVSKHVRVLQRAGLARVQHTGRIRRARLETSPMRAALEWIERYRRFWESELDQLADYLERSAAPVASATRPAHPSESPWPSKPQRNQRRPSSKSAASSARRGSASSTRGRKRKS